MKVWPNAAPAARIWCLASIVLICSLLGLEALAGGFGDDSPLPVWVSDKLPYQSPAGARAFLDQQFSDPVIMYKDKKGEVPVEISNCRSLLAGEARYQFPFDRWAYDRYVQKREICRVASTVERLKSSTVSFLEPVLFGQNDFSYVPAFLAVTVGTCEQNVFAFFANALSTAYKPKGTLVLPDLQFERKDPYEFTVSYDLHGVHYTTVAKGDVNKDGIEDVVLQFDSFSRKTAGNNVTPGSYLLTRYWSTNQPYTVLNPVRHLHGCRLENNIQYFKRWYEGSN